MVERSTWVLGPPPIGIFILPEVAFQVIFGATFGRLEHGTAFSESRDQDSPQQVAGGDFRYTKIRFLRFYTVNLFAPPAKRF